MNPGESPLLSSFLDSVLRAFEADRCEFVPGSGPAGATLQVPVRDSDRLIGHLNLHRPRPFTPEEQKRVQEFSPLLVQILRHGRLFERATTDALTGLPDRDCFLARFEEEDPSAPLALILLDPDHLKEKNEVYGRPVGDAILAELGELLRAHHAAELSARVGGEEFALLLPAFDATKARDLAETLRSAVDGREFNAHSEPVHCTASFGVAVRRPGEMPSALWARAEEALATAKRGGRNRVEVSRGG